MPEPPMWQPIIEQQRKEMFVGRKDQLRIFSDNFVGYIPKYMVFAITGEGGVGKSRATTSVNVPPRAIQNSHMRPMIAVPCGGGCIQWAIWW